MKAIRLYSQVLVDVAMSPQSGVQLSNVLAELSEFAKMIPENSMFLKVFDNPTVSDDDKQKVLKEFISKTNVSPMGARFLSLLVKRNRMGALPEIIEEVKNIEIERKGGVVGELTSATPLDSEALAGISAAISKRLNKPVQLKQKTDQSLIAGMRVTIGGVTYDGSVKGKLDQLSGSL